MVMDFCCRFLIVAETETISTAIQEKCRGQKAEKIAFQKIKAVKQKEEEIQVFWVFNFEYILAYHLQNKTQC